MIRRDDPCLRWQALAAFNPDKPLGEAKKRSFTLGCMPTGDAAFKDAGGEQPEEKCCADTKKASCVACAAGMNVDAYCKKHINSTSLMSAAMRWDGENQASGGAVWVGLGRLHEY